MAYITPRSLEESGCMDEDILGKMGSRKGMGRLKIKCLYMTSESGKWLSFTNIDRYWIPNSWSRKLKSTRSIC